MGLEVKMEKTSEGVGTSGAKVPTPSLKKGKRKKKEKEGKNKKKEKIHLVDYIAQ